MDQLKRYAGIVWMLLAPLSLYFLIRIATNEITSRPTLDAMIQWGVFIAIFIPIAIGLAIFGYFAFTGAYDRSLEGQNDVE